MKKASPELTKIVKIAFHKFDKDKSGTLDLDELEKMLREMCQALGLPECDEKQMKKVLRMIDDSGDGALDFDELMKGIPGVMDWLMVNLGRVKTGDQTSFVDNPNFIHGLGKQ